MSRIRVRNYEVDWQGIVHNANYLLYFEVGRIEYLQQLGVRIDLRAVQSDSMVVLVRNEIDYKSPAHFDEVLNVFTRILYVRNTSFAFEGIIEEEQTQRRIAQNIAIHVWLDAASGTPKTVSDEFRQRVRHFEGDSVFT